jgi:SAM-dependent methyltransferase
VIEHYEDALRRKGPVAEGMDWADERSQRLRFAVLAGVCDLDGKRVHELGAGAGHFHDFLAERGVRAEYSGSDVSPAMVEAARRLHPGVPFEVRDVLLEPVADTYDVVLCSGVFNVMTVTPESAWKEYVHAVLRRMFAMCTEAMAFNAMTDQVDFRSERLFYSSPGETADFCRRELSRHVVVRHDYPLFEYTVYVYRRPVDPLVPA